MRKNTPYELDSFIEHLKAAFLRACRQMTGLNAETFAKRYGFNSQTYRRLERVIIYLRSDMLQKLIDALASEGVQVT